MKKPPLSNDILCDITKRSVIIRVNPRNQAIDYLPASQMLFLIAILRRLTQINNSGYIRRFIGSPDDEPRRRGSPPESNGQLVLRQ